MASQADQLFMESLPSLTKLPNPVMPSYYIPDQEIKRLSARLQNDPIRPVRFFSEQSVEFMLAR